MSEKSSPLEVVEATHSEKGIPQFLTIAEVVNATGLSRPTINRKIKSGEIPHTRLGTRVLIPASFLIGLEKYAWSSMNRSMG